MPGGVTRHIRDVMNRELPPQHGQRLSCAVATTRAIDDLEHYHRLMADALREQQFTEDEASLLVSVCQDWFVCCPWEASRLWHELNDYLEIQEFETGDDTARPRWQRALVERLRNLSPLQALAVVRAAQRVWSLPPQLPLSTALIAVGLFNPEPQQLGFGWEDAGSHESEH